MVVRPEVEQHGHALLPVVAEVVGVLVGCDIHLAEQHRPGALLRDGGAQLAHEPLAVGVGPGGPGPLQHHGDGVHPEARDAHPQPERDDAVQLVAHPRVVEREVGLVRVEGVPVELLRLVVPRPRLRLDVGEHRLDVVVRLVGPDVVVAVGRPAVVPRLLEPAVLVGGVLGDQLDQQVQTEVLRRLEQVSHVGQVAQARVDGEVVADVVAAVAEGRGVEGQHPHARGAEPAQVVQPLGDAAQVAPAVFVRVGEEAGIELIDDRVGVPGGAHRGPHLSSRDGRRGTLRGGVDPCSRRSFWQVGRFIRRLLSGALLHGRCWTARLCKHGATNQDDSHIPRTEPAPSQDVSAVRCRQRPVRRPAGRAPPPPRRRTGPGTPAA